MFAVPVKRIAWIIPLALSAAIVTYFAWLYSLVRNVDQLKLVHAALFERNAFAAHFANFEAKRRIWNGSENGVDSLNYVLGLVDFEIVDRAEILAYAESLLNAGVEINGYSSQGVTALHDAIFRNSPSAVRFLLEHCADPDAPTSTQTDTTKQMNAIELAYWEEKISGGRQDFDEVFDLLNSQYPQCFD